MRKVQQFIQLNDIPGELYLGLVLQYCQAQHWQVMHVSGKQVVATIRPTLKGLGTWLSVSVKGGSIEVEAHDTTLISWGGSAHHVHNLTVGVAQRYAQMTDTERLEAIQLHRDRAQWEEVEFVYRHSAFEMLILRTDHLATPLLCLMLAIIWLGSVAKGMEIWNPTVIQILSSGGSITDLVLMGQLWRPFVANVVNIHPVYLLVNMLGVVYLGAALEHVVKSYTFTIVFLATGTIGYCVSTFFHIHFPSSGSTPGLMGLMGAYLAFRWMGFIRSKDDFLTGYNILWFLLLLIGCWVIFPYRVDYAANMGSAVAGFLLGMMAVPILKVHPRLVWIFGVNSFAAAYFTAIYLLPASTGSLPIVELMNKARKVENEFARDINYYRSNFYLDEEEYADQILTATARLEQTLGYYEEARELAVHDDQLCEYLTLKQAILRHRMKQYRYYAYHLGEYTPPDDGDTWLDKYEEEQRKVNDLKVEFYNFSQRNSDRAF